MSNQSPPSIDPQAALRWQRRTQSQSAWLHEEVARRMQERLAWITRQPDSLVHWAPHKGGREALSLLQLRYPKAKGYTVEPGGTHDALVVSRVQSPWWHPARWRALVQARDTLPSGGVSLLWANMALHMSAQPQALIAQWHKMLAVDGFLMFSCLGPDTLRELRVLYQRMGWPEPAHAFTDMHDWGDMLVQSGFSEPVMDMERITLSFETPERLLQELRELGRNLHGQRFDGLRGRGWLVRLKQALREQLAQPAEDGRLCLSFEIVYGHAFKPTPRLSVAAQTVVSLDDMRQALAAGKTRSPSP